MFLSIPVDLLHNEIVSQAPLIFIFLSLLGLDEEDEETCLDLDELSTYGIN